MRGSVGKTATPMGLPLVPIITAIAPVVLGAFDLYRKRREATEAHAKLPVGDQELGRTAEDIRRRMQELEQSDVEQARLISELSNTIEALTKTLQREIEDGRAKDARLRQMLWIAMAGGAVNLLLVLWIALR